MARVPVQISVADPATGNALAGVSATVKHRVTATNLTLYAAESGGSTVTNPLTTDANGRATAWADRAPFRIDYSGTGLTPWTEYRDVGPSSDRGADSLLLPLGALPALVTALPGSPVDGEEVYYQSAAMATDGVAWHLRYRTAAAGSYKWEFVGGSPLTAEVTTQETTASGSYVDLTTVGPSVTLPLAGDYMFDLAVLIQPASVVNAWAGATPQYGVTTADIDMVMVSTPAASAMSAHVARTIRRGGRPAAEVVKMVYRVSGGTGTFSRRTLAARPVRVG